MVRQTTRPADTCSPWLSYLYSGTMDHRYIHIAGSGLALSGALATGASLILSDNVVFSEVAPVGVIVLGGILALVLGLRNVLAKTRTEYDLEHSVAYRVANWGAVL